MNKLLFSNVSEQSILEQISFLREMKEKEMWKGGSAEEFSKSWQIEQLVKKSWGNER